MEIKRIGIKPGVFLNHVHSEKFKTSFLSISLLTQLNRDTASMNALIPFVLRRGTQTYSDMEQLSNRLDELYGSVIEPAVRRIGEIQCIGFCASFPEEKFLPADSNVLKNAISLISEMLISPVTKGGLLLPQYVDSERDKLADIIRSRINEKRSYALTRCIEEMCCFEDFSVGRFGSVEDCENINYTKLTKQYHILLQTAPVEILYFGREDADSVAEMLQDALCTMPRSKINYDIGTDVRMNSVEESSRYFEEELDVLQGKLVIGWRLGMCMEDPNIPAPYVFNSLFGSSPTSKLFLNVREKLSLCYYASSIVDFHKGLLLVHSGIDFSNFDATKNEIFHQLGEVAKGNITDEEILSAKAGVISDLKALSDSQSDLETFCISNIIDGSDISPEALACLVEKVSPEEIASIAAGVEPDMVYFLKGIDREGNE